MRRIGILSAIPQEFDALGEAFTEMSTPQPIAGLGFHAGTLEDRAVVFVESGIGKVNAALAATLLIRDFGCDCLIFTGVAGGLDPALKVGDVVIGERLVQHDYGALLQERLEVYQPGIPPLPHADRSHGYEPDARLIARLRPALARLDLAAVESPDGLRRPKIAYGTILTGDTFMNCAVTRVRLHQRFQAQAVEMEGGAIAQVAERFGTGYVVIRALSDLAGEESHMDFQTFLADAATTAATITRAVLRLL